jgi:CHAT domain-containing protein
MERALLIRNPQANLKLAGTEVQALRDTYYPDAVVLGPVPGRTDGEATARALLDEAGRRGCSLLHYAGHAAVRADASELSGLVLSDADVPAQRLMRLRTEGGDGFLVCLAACTTHLTTQAFDGAFTLATAFLVGGASTVVASLWRVDDDPTAVLMFMLHHHLARGLAPADALRRAQLWMIDPERLIPASMPAAVRRVVRVANLSDPASWASMVHHDGDRRVASAGQRADQVARARLSA